MNGTLIACSSTFNYGGSRWNTTYRLNAEIVTRNEEKRTCLVRFYPYLKSGNGHSWTCMYNTFLNLNNARYMTTNWCDNDSSHSYNEVLLGGPYSVICECDELGNMYPISCYGGTTGAYWGKDNPWYTFSANCAFTGVLPKQKYNITYNMSSDYQLDVDTENPYAVEQKTHGDDYTILSMKYSSPNYTFKYWSGSNNNDYIAESKFTSNYELTLTSVWEPNTYNIKYILNNSQSPITSTFTFGEYVNLKETPIKSGYTFKGWKLNTNSVVYNANEQIRVNDDLKLNTKNEITFEAIWEANNYKIYLHLGLKDKTPLPESPRIINVTYGSKISGNFTLNIPGYKLVGWSEAPQLKTFPPKHESEWLPKVFIEVGDFTLSPSSKIYNDYANDITLYPIFEYKSTSYISVNNKLRLAIPYIYKDGKWRISIGYTNVNGRWKL